MEKAYVVNFQTLWNYGQHKSCQGDQWPLGEVWNLLASHYVSYFSLYSTPVLPSLPRDGWSLLYNNIHKWTKVQAGCKAVQWNELLVTPFTVLRGSQCCFSCFLPEIFPACTLLSVLFFTQMRAAQTHSSVPCFCIFFSNFTSHQYWLIQYKS